MRGRPSRISKVPDGKASEGTKTERHKHRSTGQGAGMRFEMGWREGERVASSRSYLAGGDIE